MEKIVLVTGGFDPLHSGHIAYFKAAKELGDKLYVGINSDAWLTRKKGRPFMSWDERAAIIRELECVDEVIGFVDNDDTARHAIVVTRLHEPTAHIIFANGGDRDSTTVPEQILDGRPGRLTDAAINGVEFVFGVGGDDKRNSSSWLLQDWKAPKTERPWGYYRVLHEDGKQTKVKELTVNPNKTLSMQRHEHRDEYWHVSSGTATVYLSADNPRHVTLVELDAGENLTIPAGTWHRLANDTIHDVRVVEIQYGTKCLEDDIERLNEYKKEP